MRCMNFVSNFLSINRIVMKYILLFIFLFSCSTKHENNTSLKVDNQGTSKPISPYTVEPCFCMKIFSPVCSDGKTYGNSCEAECDGHKTWTEGPCKKSTK